MADLARRHATATDLRLEGKTVAQVAPTSHNARHQRALLLGTKQSLQGINLIHGDQLEDFAAHFACWIAGQLAHELELLGRAHRFIGANELPQAALGQRGLSRDKRVKPGTGSTVGKCYDRCFAHLRMSAQAFSNRRSIEGEPRSGAFAIT